MKKITNITKLDNGLFQADYLYKRIKKNMKYTIFIRGKNWSFQLARALDDKQKLKYLVTSYPKFYIENSMLIEIKLNL